MLDGAAAALPEGGLPQPLAEAGRFVGAFADQEGGEQLHRRRHQGLARHGAADADEALVGDDLDDGVDVVFGLELIGPAAFDGAAGEAGETDVGDFHDSAGAKKTSNVNSCSMEWKRCSAPAGTNTSVPAATGWSSAPTRIMPLPLTTK